jgi:hypothetical protein
MNTRVVFLFLSAISMTSAAELVVRDGAINLELLPSDFSYSFSGPSLSASGDDAFESHNGLLAGVRYSIAGPGDTHGFLIGGGLTAAQASYGSVGHLSQFGLRVEGGYGWSISDRWLVSSLIDVGYGISTFDLTANSVIPSVSLSGKVLSYGVRAEGDYAITDLFHTQVAVGWRHFGHDLSGGGIDMTLDNDGIFIALGLSYRLSNSPSPLE